MTDMNYVLVTPARNEEGFIEKTIRAVTAQTVLPKKWVIVSDGSTDRTDDIVREFTSTYTFISLLRRSNTGGDRSCGSKVKAFQAGYQELLDVPHDYIGNLDADVSFAPDYFEQILNRFQANPVLGIGGGIIHELIGKTFVPQWISPNSVAGAVQLFRRACYEQIGGYFPVRLGGEDAAAEIMARARGWEVQTFDELPVRHYRQVSSGEGALVRTKLRHGMSHYALGYHPLFEMVRNTYKVSERPYLVGSVLMTVGYWWALVTRIERELPEDVIRYLHLEQTRRLWSTFQRPSTMALSKKSVAEGEMH
jgi:poly-beta-1,6-N-acetyl-D-glucosamine synthase